MFELKVQMFFSSAHHLLNYNGKCENMHGHNWLTEAFVSGTELDKSNILVDYKVIKSNLKEVLDYLDHKDINELPEFQGISPSSEILAKFIYEQMKKRIPQTSKVAVWETSTSCTTYWED
jgi:6-pyruvoyltetrahydropterin/6-carboxytetrahydropterin synthase